MFRGLGLLGLLAPLCLAQSSGTLRGRLVDQSGAAIAAGRVTLTNAVTGFERGTVADENGEFTLGNLPLQAYQLRAEAPSFAPAVEVVELTSVVPVEVRVALSLGETVQKVTVVDAEQPLVDPQRTGTYAQMNRGDIERMALQVGNRGLEAVLVSFPGFAQNANGAIHPRGAHNQMTFVIDGMPVTDQLTGAFANAVDPNLVETVELFTGHIPAEYGNKTAAVVNVSTRSGYGTGKTFHGSVQASAAQFDTVGQVTQVAGESGRFGYSASVNTMKTHRYLDAVSLDNLHNGGNSERGFARLDFHASARDIFRFQAMSGNADFEVANLRSQQAVGMDQRQRLRDFSALAGWVRTLSPAAVFESTTSFRAAGARLAPSTGDFPVTALQSRRMATFNTANRLSVGRGSHQLRVGADYQRFPVREHFRFGITDPLFNDPAADNYIPALTAHDLSRGGAMFEFSDRATGSLTSGFAQDQVKWKRFQFALGLRYDYYRFLVRGSQWQPRLGVSFHIAETGTVLRASYNRTYQTPPNENLLLSNSVVSAALAPPGVRATFGSAVMPIRAERQNVYEAGVQQAIGRRATVSVSYQHKDAWDQSDNNNFFNTGIIFPMSLAQIRVNGVEGRLVVPLTRGFSGTLSATHARAVSTPPFTGGLFLGNDAVEALSRGAFLIDHDQKLSLHGTLSYTNRRGWFGTLSLRHDSGLVSNPSDPTVVAADPDYADLLPYVDLDAATPRVRPRTVADVVAGYARSSEGRRVWEASVQVTNLTNRTALYNFQSLFVGTRVVPPRTVGVRLRWFF